MRFLLFIGGLILLLVACKKNTGDSVPPPDPIDEMGFDTCECSPATVKGGEGEYISAEINGIPVCFDAKPALPDTFANMMRHGFISRDTGDQYYDNVNMIRNSSDGKWQAAFFFENTHALNRTYPYTLPRANSFYCEIGEFQLISQQYFSPCSSCAGTNSYSFYGQFWRDYMKITVTGFKDDFFEGEFSGTARSQRANPAKITNGKFRIRLIVYYDYIDLP